MNPAATSAPILVVQSPEATAQQVAALADACGATRSRPRRARLRLRSVQRPDGVAAWCEAHRPTMPGGPKSVVSPTSKLLAMDMDSTL